MAIPLLAFGLPSGPDMIVISILVLVLFGAKKSPLFGRSLGRSMGGFRKAREEFDNEIDRHWQSRRGDQSGRTSSLNLHIILFIASIVVLLASFIAQRPH